MFTLDICGQNQQKTGAILESNEDELFLNLFLKFLEKLSSYFFSRGSFTFTKCTLFEFYV